MADADAGTEVEIVPGILVRRRAPRCRLEAKLARLYGRRVHRVLAVESRPTYHLGIKPVAVLLWEGRRRFVARSLKLDFQPLTLYRREWVPASRYVVKEEVFYRDGWFSLDLFEPIDFTPPEEARAEVPSRGEAQRQVGERLHCESVHSP